MKGNNMKQRFIKIESELLQLSVIFVISKLANINERILKIQKLLPETSRVQYLKKRRKCKYLDPIQNVISEVKSPYVWIVYEDTYIGKNELVYALAKIAERKLQFISIESREKCIGDLKVGNVVEPIIEYSNAQIDICRFGMELQYNLSNIIFVNPNNYMNFKNREWSFQTSFGATRFFLDYATRGPIARLSYVQDVDLEMHNESFLWESLDYYNLVEAGRYLKDLYQYYHVSEDDIRHKYKKMMESLLKNTKYNQIELYKKCSLDAILMSQKKPNILISIHSFSKGAGELVPIVLANQYFLMDYHVYLHILTDDGDKELARNLLYPDIPCIQTESEEELEKFIEEYDIKVIHTHHQANQSLVAALYRKSPELHKKTSHIATTHGMYELFDDETLKYLLEVQLKDTVDQWVYVEDKNLEPFKILADFKGENYIKIPETEVASVLFDKIQRESDVQDLRNLTRLRDGVENLSDMANAYTDLYQMHFYKLMNQEIDKRLEWYEAKKIADSKKETMILHSIERQSEGLSLEKRLSVVGDNTGNLMFSNALVEQLCYKKEKYICKKDIIYTKWRNTSTAIPACNYIIKGNDGVAKKMRPFLKYHNNQVTLVGLGAQSSAECSTPRELVKALSKTNIHFFKTVSERAVSIGVRGEFTACCLEELGIYNVRIIGCPSMYYSLDGKVKLPSNPTTENVMFSVTGGNEMENHIVELGIQQHAKWIMQMGVEFNEFLEKPIKIPLTMPKGTYPGIHIAFEKIKEYQESNAKIFFNIKEWDEYIQNNQFTFSFGSRFHGNVAALRNGVPALFIVHDSRTKELTEAMHLPHITYSTLSKVKSVEELLDYCDYSDYEKNIGKLYKNYVDFLEENGLSHRFHLS